MDKTISKKDRLTVLQGLWDQEELAFILNQQTYELSSSSGFPLNGKKIVTNSYRKK